MEGGPRTNREGGSPTGGCRFIDRFCGLGGLLHSGETRPRRGGCRLLGGNNDADWAPIEAARAQRKQRRLPPVSTVGLLQPTGDRAGRPPSAHNGHALLVERITGVPSIEPAAELM
ncbi:hypothetical protein NDU88_002952 [Pleurodeles waltl]|uniref:Uncharacterized protein n=1 Tax=Pleurodeles waltl TaxID=8319 RepID=A0AAV7KX23_PLEWA|nr:hypothetical protein NDU88_002952 [Pleurodeles waltl]